MRIFSSIFTLIKSRFYKREVKKEITDRKQEMLLRQGSEQFRALIKKGLSIPVTLL